MTLEEENKVLRDIVEHHVFNQMALCSQTLRDLRKLRASGDELSPFFTKDPRDLDPNHRIQW